MAAIEIINFTKLYGSFEAASNINLNVDEGEIFGFIGPNGAGKSTTIRTLLNFIFPSSGKLSVMGMDTIKQSEQIKKVIGYVPSEVRYYNNVKVADLLKYATGFHSNVDQQRIKNLSEIFEVDDKKKMKDLSLGNKKKIAIIQALIHQPQLIILDEPTNGLDPLMQSRLLNVLSEENKKGTTIFFSSHNLAEVQSFCKKVAIIKQGKIMDVKNLQSIQDNIFRIQLITQSEMGLPDKLNGVKRFTKDGDMYTIDFDGDMNELIRTLSTLNISHIEITRMGIEESFMKYYN